MERNDVDYVIRDPNYLNNHLIANYEQVFGEPTSLGIFSAKCVWRNAYKCYTCTRTNFYKFYSCLCGLKIGWSHIQLISFSFFFFVGLVFL